MYDTVATTMLGDIHIPSLHATYRQSTEIAVVFKVHGSVCFHCSCSLSQDGVTPLYMACQNGHSDEVDILIRCGANVNQARDVRLHIPSLHICILP